MRFSFGDACLLDETRRELWRDRELVPVEPQVFDLLLHLIRHHERVVTRDEVFATVWRGRIVSESTLASRINAARRAIGDDGRAQRLIRTVARRGLRFVGEVCESSLEAASSTKPPPRQEVRFFRTGDGVNLAVALLKNGSETLVKTANWLNHVEFDWQNPVWAPLLHRLAHGRCLVRYDARGTGLSDRQVPNISFDSFLLDLECVVDSLGLSQFALMGISQGAAVAISYAARHPERVSRLVLLGGFAQGRNVRGERELANALLALVRHGWGADHPEFVRTFGALFFPSASPVQLAAWTDLQRVSASAATAVSIRSACDDIDVESLLPLVRAPTLVLHSRGDCMAPFDQGRRLAAGIPNARFVALESSNHLLLPDEPEWDRLSRELDCFLGS